MMRLLLSVVLSLLLTACATVGESCARLPGNGRYCLVPGPWPEFAAEQASTVTLQGKTLRMISRLEAGPEGLRFAGLSPLGQTLFLISWEKSALLAELPPALEGRLDPALFPALLQIATWPSERIQEGFSEGLELIDTPGHRVIRNAAGDILIVSWEGNQLPYARLRIEIPAVHLVIDSQTLGNSQ